MSDKSKIPELIVVKKEDKEIKLMVRTPTPVEGKKGQAVYNQAFATSLSTGGLLRARVEAYMRAQNIWDDVKEQQQQEYIKQLSDMELRLKKGGIKLSEAKKIALSMREVRGNLRTLLGEKNRLDINTVEGQADNARFNALVSLCLVYNDSGEPYYKSVEDYLSHASDPEAYEAAQALGNIMFNMDKNYEANLPENQFLIKRGFVDKELRLVNSGGKLVDDEGRLINEEGRFIDKDGKFVDRDGRPVDKDGSYVVEFTPFLDEDGNAIPEETSTSPE